MPNSTPDLIEIRVNPPDLFARMARYPKELDREMDKTTAAALLEVHASVPPYPPQRVGSSYKRTHILEMTLGIGGTDHRHIRKVKRLGRGRYEGRFGTRLHYAPKVIGTLTQLPLFKKLGWYTMRTIKDKAQKGVVKLFNNMADRMVKFLGG